MRKHIIAGMFAMLATVAIAMPAKRGVNRTMPLPDGTSIMVSLVGDEFGHYWIDAAGNKYHANEDGILQLRNDAQDDAQQLSRMKARKSQANGNRTKRLMQNKASGLFQGKKKGLIILVQFTDVKFKSSNPKTQFTRIANEENYSEGDFKGSVRDYFLSQSRGQFELDFDVVGPIQLEHNMAYYGANDRYGNDMRPEEMVVEACQAANAEVNFADYDWDGDGEVDQVYILYAGYGEADTGKENTIWPHEYQLSASNASMRLDGVTIDTYACSNELNYNGTTAGIGTLCHEFSHCMGIPDIYDTAYSGNFGTGPWDLMCSGGYNGDGYQPAGYTSYERMVSGWIDPVEVLPGTTLDVAGMKALEDGGEAYRITNSGNSNEYFLIENRQQTGWDASLPGKGVLVLHVDYDPTCWSYNIVNTTDNVYSGVSNSHQRLTLIHADNDDDKKYWDSSQQYYRRTTYTGDPYPYNGNDSLTAMSTPSNRVYTNTASGKKYMEVSIRNIALAADGSASMSFGPTYIGQTNTGETIFQETFDGCQGTGGNDNIYSGGNTVGNDAFNPDNSGWVAQNAYGANACAKFGTSKNVGYATTPSFGIDGTATFSFRAVPWGTDGGALALTVNGNATISPSSFTMTAGVWKTFTATITGSGNVSVQFRPAKRFFLDDVTVSEGSTAVSNITETQPKAIQAVFSIDGTRRDGMAKGINIVKYTDGTVSKIMKR